MRDALGLDRRVRCCEDPAGLGVPQEDIEPPLALPAPVAEFQSHCAVCHRTPERFPPNFLAGDKERVSASLAQCAPRIFVRLTMWQMPPAARDKVPMPPPQASRDGSPWVQTAPDPAIALLQSTVAGWLRAETGRTPDAAAMLARGYENLRPCLPAGA
jgi:mono/diheme cytochrome c family protein